MILDSLNNTEKVECLHPLFKKAFDYVKATDFSKMEDGKYELDGARLFVSVASLSGKDKNDAAIETHKKYIDIQLPLLGVEKSVGNRDANCRKFPCLITKRKTSLSSLTARLPIQKFIPGSSPSIFRKTAMHPVSEKEISAK